MNQDIFQCILSTRETINLNCNTFHLIISLFHHIRKKLRKSFIITIFLNKNRICYLSCRKIRICLLIYCSSELSLQKNWDLRMILTIYHIFTESVLVSFIRNDQFILICLLDIHILCWLYLLFLNFIIIDQNFCLFLFYLLYIDIFRFNI